MVTIPESVIIGIVGSWLGNITAPLLIWLRVDDAVGATCVHGKMTSIPRKHRTRGLFSANSERPSSKERFCPFCYMLPGHLTGLTLWYKWYNALSRASPINKYDRHSHIDNNT